MKSIPNDNLTDSDEKPMAGEARQSGTENWSARLEYVEAITRRNGQLIEKAPIIVEITL